MVVVLVVALANARRSARQIDAHLVVTDFVFARVVDRGRLEAAPP